MATEQNGGTHQAIVMRPDEELEAFPSGADVRATTGLDALARSEIDVQVATAHRYPRNIGLAVKRAESMAVLDEETAISCFYALPREGKTIEGPSVRLAEIFSSSWGNLRAGSRIVDEGDKFIVAQGFCHDLETNNAYGAEVAQRITKKNGQRYNDDMVGVAAAAAQAKAYRNAVFKVIPRAYINKVMRAAKAVAVGDASTLVSKRTKAIEWFGKVGVLPDRILAKLGRASVEDVTLDDIGVLLGLSTAIRDRMTTPDEAFPVAKAVAAGEAPAKAADVAAHVAAVAARVAEPAKQPEPAQDDKASELFAIDEALTEAAGIENATKAAAALEAIQKRLQALPDSPARKVLVEKLSAAWPRVLNAKAKGGK